MERGGLSVQGQAKLRPNGTGILEGRGASDGLVGAGADAGVEGLAGSYIACVPGLSTILGGSEDCTVSHCCLLELSLALWPMPFCGITYSDAALC